MKKTEKIEIRLSHDDKERLNTIAESEGRTISQIVRDLIDKYMDLNSARKSKQVSTLEKMKWGIAGAVCSALLFIPFVLNKGPTAHAPIMKNTEIILWPSEGMHTIARFSFPLKDGFSETTEIHADEKLSFEISTQSSLVANDRFKVHFEFCEVKENACDFATGTDLFIEKNTSAETVIFDPHGNKFTISISGES